MKSAAEETVLWRSDRFVFGGGSGRGEIRQNRLRRPLLLYDAGRSGNRDTLKSLGYAANRQRRADDECCHSSAANPPQQTMRLRLAPYFCRAYRQGFRE